MKRKNALLVSYVQNIPALFDSIAKEGRADMGAWEEELGEEKQSLQAYQYRYGYFSTPPK